MNKINLTQDLKDFWQLKTLGNINNHTINLIKIKGEFEWHTHEEEDKLLTAADSFSKHR